VAFEPQLIVQVPGGGALERQLREAPPAVADRRVVVEVGPTDTQGNLEPPAAGQVVFSVPSPEALERERDEIRPVIEDAGAGDEPLVVVVEAAEELRDEELAGVLEAAGHSPRPVILRVLREA
jgi:hypothetical protein